jgi:two-component system, cell cycle response regulator
LSFDQGKDTFVGLLWAALRAEGRLFPEVCDDLVARTKAALEALDPVSSLDLRPIHALMTAAGMSTTCAAQVLLFVVREAGETGFEIELPDDVARLPPSAKKQLAEEFALGFVRELPPHDERVPSFDLTPIIDLKSLAVRDPTDLAGVFVVIQGREPGRSFKLTKGVTRIGRHTENDVVIADDGVSRTHAHVAWDGRGYVVKDAGSKNGIVVNGFVVGEHQLEEGDRVQIGSNTVLKFTMHDQFEHDYQAILQRHVAFDVVTGTYNKRHFLDRLRAECAYFGRHGGTLAIMGVVVDDHAAKLDAHGPRVADEFLRVLGGVVRASVRVEDIVGRGEGEEILVILRGASAESANVVAERVRSRVAALVVHGHEGAKLTFTVSMTIVGFVPQRRDTPVELLAAVARGLAEATAKGGDCVVASLEA